MGVNDRPMQLLSRASSWLLAGYALLLTYWMLYSFGRTSGGTYRYNVIPFKTIRMYGESDVLSRDFLLNICGNIGVFVPFGLLIPLALRIGFVKSFGIFLFGLSVLEITQFATRRGSLDVDDYILNAAGFCLGYLIYSFYRRRK